MEIKIGLKLNDFTFVKMTPRRVLFGNQQDCYTTRCNVSFT